MKSRGYVVLGLHKEEEKALGVIENSFSMGVSDKYIRVFRPMKRYRFDDDYNQRTYNNLKSYVQTYNQSYPNYEFKVYRIGSKNIPISIDWEPIARAQKHKIRIDKFRSRNLLFLIKNNNNEKL